MPKQTTTLKNKGDNDLNSIATLLSDIETNEKIRDRDEEDIDPRVKAGYGILRNLATEEAEKLRNELGARTIPSRLIGVFASGVKASEVADYLSQEGAGGISLNASKVWSEIAADVDVSFGSDRDWGANQHTIMTSKFGSLARSVGYKQIDSPPFAMADCGTVKKIEAHVRSSIRGVVGDDFLLRLLKSDIVNAVIDEGLSAANIPVVILNADESEIPSLKLLFSRSGKAHFDEEFEINPQSLTKAIRSATIQPNEKTEESKQ